VNFNIGVERTCGILAQCGHREEASAVRSILAEVPQVDHRIWPTSPARPRSCAKPWTGISLASDRYSAQQRHGSLHQTCLAHLARDVAYGPEASEDPVPFRLKLWFDRVFAFAVDLAGMAQSTLRAKKRELER
jgi:transposase